MAKSDTQIQVELRERLQRKFPSMSEAALRSAMLAAQTTLEGQTPNTTRTTGITQRLANERRGRDARKR